MKISVRATKVRGFDSSLDHHKSMLEEDPDKAVSTEAVSPAKLDRQERVEKHRKLRVGSYSVVNS